MKAVPRVLTVEVRGTVEVLHWWTSGGEAKAVGELQSGIEDAGGAWIDAPSPVVATTRP